MFLSSLFQLASHTFQGDHQQRLCCQATQAKKKRHQQLLAHLLVALEAGCVSQNLVYHVASHPVYNESKEILISYLPHIDI